MKRSIVNFLTDTDEAFKKALLRSRDIVSDTFRFGEEQRAGFKGDAITAGGFRNNRARKNDNGLAAFALLRDVSLFSLAAQITTLDINWKKLGHFVSSAVESVTPTVAVKTDSLSSEAQALLADEAIDASGPIAVSKEFHQALSATAQDIAVQNAPVVEQLANPDFIGPFPEQQHYLSKAYHDSAISFNALENGVLRNAGILRNGAELVAVTPEIFDKVSDNFNSIAPDHVHNATCIHTFRQVAHDEATTLRLAAITDKPRGPNGEQIVLRLDPEATQHSGQRAPVLANA